MIKRISKTDDLRNRFKQDGKSKSLESTENIQAMVRMNKELEQLKKDYIVKDRQSQISASQVILNS
jgi:hypothetical protein